MATSSLANGGDFNYNLIGQHGHGGHNSGANTNNQVSSRNHA
jgi:hypothetical protein